MKDFLAALAGALLITQGALTFAASSIELSVRGSITPSACAPSLSEGGQVDFGKIAVKDLAVVGSTKLPPVTLTLSVECEADTLFALIGKDNRRGTAQAWVPDHFYGLGLINGDEKLGSYEIGVFNPVADTLVYPLYSADQGQTWLINSFGSYMGHNHWSAFGDSTTPKALSHVTVDLRISAMIAPTNGLTLTEEVPLDGSATLDVIYL